LSCIVSASDGVSSHPKFILCASCHGEKGISVGPLIPNLAGQKKDYMIKALSDYRSGNRNNAVMGMIIVGFRDNDFAGLASYHSGQIVVD